MPKHHEAPEWARDEIEARGGVIRVRTIKRKTGRLFRVAIVRKPGPRGGRTVSWEVK